MRTNKSACHTAAACGSVAASSVSSLRAPAPTPGGQGHHQPHPSPAQSHLASPGSRPTPSSMLKPLPLLVG